MMLFVSLAGAWKKYLEVWGESWGNTIEIKEEDEYTMKINEIFISIFYESQIIVKHDP